MKKTLLPIALLSSVCVSFAQLVPVTYKGAFAPSPEESWTTGWTEFEPQTKAYPVTNTDVEGQAITTNTNWTKDKVYNLKGYVFVESGATLTIEAGTIIRSTAKASLIIKRGGKIMAEGTATSPIVFTSNSADNSRVKGDWGGVVICGAAKHNKTSGPDAKVEGDITATYGGDNDADNSGVFRYVRIEFPGQALSAANNSEINGLSLYSVGSGTKIDHVQVSYSGDDSFEWFGGTVNASHLVAYRGVDDDFDTDNGYTGTVQFGVSHRHVGTADQSGSNSFESDNDAEGSAFVPVTAPVFANMTIIGPRYSTTAPDANFKRAAHIRRNSACSIINSIIVGYTDAGLLLDGVSTVTNAVNGKLMFTNNYIADNVTNFKLASSSAALTIQTSADVKTWALAAEKNNIEGTEINPGLIKPFALNNTVDYRPATSNNTNLQVVTGLEDALALSAIEKVVVFPNPANENVQIALNSEFANATVTVQNAMGMTVASTKAFGESVTFDVSGFANGLYIVSVTNGGNALSKTLLINR
jgi:hypothetical protein